MTVFEAYDSLGGVWVLDSNTESDPLGFREDATHVLHDLVPRETRQLWVVEPHDVGQAFDVVYRLLEDPSRRIRVDVGLNRELLLVEEPLR
eukprot:jgi/Tetstr1/432457/TSEL_021833.t1